MLGLFLAKPGPTFVILQPQKSRPLPQRVLWGAYSRNDNRKKWGLRVHRGYRKARIEPLDNLRQNREGAEGAGRAGFFIPLESLGDSVVEV